jgi:PIN domain nuclease of toxin-antitoxin system
VASLWELTIKQSIGKLKVDGDLRAAYDVPILPA